MPDNASVTYTFANDSPADADEVNQNFSDILAYLNSRVGDIGTGAIPIGSSPNGELVGRTISGDITISATGVAEIGAAKVGTPELADDGVTAAKIASNAVGASEIGTLPVCIGERSGAQSIPNDNETSIQFNAETLDTDTIHDNATNNERFTVNTAGVYALSGWVEFDNDSTGRREAYIWRFNSAGVPQETVGVVQQPNAPASNNALLGVSGVAKAAAGDFFCLRVYQTSGGALNMLDARMSVHWLGDG